MRARPSVMADLARYGPEQAAAVGLDEARAYCRRLALGHYENFSVLSPLVPADRRDDFAAIYAFARWADDLGDEAGSPERSLELLAWWRGALEAMAAGEARHPVFVALSETVARRGLDLGHFRDLVSAFEMDQVKTRYATFAELVGYCRLSANPVGRLVLAALGEKCDAAQLAASDAVCTALQLTNHWQDIRRDWTERRRIYVPADMHAVEGFEERLARTIELGCSCDAAFFGESRKVVRRLVARTWELFEEGRPLVASVSPASRPLVWLFAAGGRSVLRNIERWNCETVLARPRLSAPRRLALVARALVAARAGVRLPELPGPSMWLIDPEPDPEAAAFPRAGVAMDAVAAGELAVVAAGEVAVDDVLAGAARVGVAPVSTAPTSLSPSNPAPSNTVHEP
ncbi:MAG: squalene synthase HpnC [Planctomycetota bacterium]